MTKLAKTAIAVTIMTVLGGMGSVARGGVGSTVVDPFTTPDVVDQFEGMLMPPKLTDVHGAGDQWGSPLLTGTGVLDLNPPGNGMPGVMPIAPAMAPPPPPPVETSTPEPTSLSLLAIGAAAMLMRRKR